MNEKINSKYDLGGKTALITGTGLLGYEHAMALLELNQII